MSGAFALGVALGLVLRVPLWLSVLCLTAAVSLVLTFARAHLFAISLTGLVLGILTDTRDPPACLEAAVGPEPVGVWLLVVSTADEVGGRTIVEPWRVGCRGALAALGIPPDVTGGSLVLVAGRISRRGVTVDSVRASIGSVSWRYVIAARIGRRIDAHFPAHRGVVRALLLGNRTGIERETRELFVRAGIAHLLAISGLHVGLLGGWIVLVISLTRLTPHLPAVACIWVYVAFLGFPAPATRAAAFLTVQAIARARQRNPGPTVTLAHGVLVVLLVEPSSAAAVGPWLSVAAVWGVHRAVVQARRLGWESLFTKLAAGSCGATIATAPITAWAFGSVAPVGVLTNLIAIPLAGVIVPGVVLALMFGSLIAPGVEFLIDVLTWIAGLAGRVPWGFVEGSGPAFVATWTAILIGLAVVTNRSPVLPVAVRRLLILAVVVIWTSNVAAALHRNLHRNGGMTIEMLDVGQGDAFLVRTERGVWLAVDAGPPGRGGTVVASALRRHGVDSLAGLFVSHGDADHVGGARQVLAEVGVGAVFGPGQVNASSAFVEFLDEVRSLGLPWTVLRAGDTLVAGSTTLVVHHPSDRWMRENLEANESSLVFTLAYRDFSMLFTGDVGAAAESVLTAEVATVDVLKVGHHGSATSTSHRFVVATAPRVAVISVGRGNSYGHPAPGVIRRLREAGVRTFRTDRDGAVTI
ncbi:MAG: DNA internalization-related competence protein ComEC/Rec2, partial [Gemmatimonadales bacterium]